MSESQHDRLGLFDAYISSIEDTYIVKLGWLCGMLWFFNPYMQKYSCSASSLINLTRYPKWLTLPNACYINWRKNSNSLSKFRYSESDGGSELHSLFLSEAQTVFWVLNVQFVTFQHLTQYCCFKPLWYKVLIECTLAFPFNPICTAGLVEHIVSPRELVLVLMECIQHQIEPPCQFYLSNADSLSHNKSLLKISSKKD